MSQITVVFSDGSCDLVELTWNLKVQTWTKGRCDTSFCVWVTETASHWNTFKTAAKCDLDIWKYKSYIYIISASSDPVWTQEVTCSPGGRSLPGRWGVAAPRRPAWSMDRQLRRLPGSSGLPVATAPASRPSPGRHGGHLHLGWARAGTRLTEAPRGPGTQTQHTRLNLSAPGSQVERGRRRGEEQGVRAELPL